jgi:hypothetical protein
MPMRVTKSAPHHRIGPRDAGRRRPLGKRYRGVRSGYIRETPNDLKSSVLRAASVKS